MIPAPYVSVQCFWLEIQRNGCSEKISVLYNTFGVVAKHAVKDKWNGVSMSITLERKLNCSSEE